MKKDSKKYIDEPRTTPVSFVRINTKSGYVELERMPFGIVIRTENPEMCIDKDHIRQISMHLREMIQ